jgi:hypothetical protein
MTFRIVFRACDKVFSDHKIGRPFTNSKQAILEVSFNSLLQSLSGYDYSVDVIGDTLSERSIHFFNSYEHVTVHNMTLGCAKKSMIAAINQSLQFDEEDWVYNCEDDYLHAPHFMSYLTEFIENKNLYLALKSRKGNRTRRFTGDLTTKPLFIYPADYPDRYQARNTYFSLLFLSKHCHWRQISNTTHTFITQTKILRTFKEEIIEYDDAYLSRKVYGRNWLRGKALCVSPIPGLTTHLTEGVMSPFVDWESYFKTSLEQINARQQLNPLSPD